MRRMTWTAAAVAVMAACAPRCAAQTGYTTVSAANLGGSGTKIASATIYFQPLTGPSGTPGSARVGGSGSGQISQPPWSATVTSGVFSLSIPDALATSPNICYAVTAIDATGVVDLGAGLAADGVHVNPGGYYGCVQPTGSSWSFDSYVPTSTTPTVLPASLFAAPSTTTGAPGSSAAASVSLLSDGQYQLGFTIPAGLTGAVGATGPQGQNAPVGSFSGAYASGTSYALGAVVTYSSQSYVSLIASNLGNEPDTHPADWALLVGLSNLPAAFASQSAATPAAGTFETLTAKGPPVNITHPDFAYGQPIVGVTVSGGACTSNPTVTLSAPFYAQDGSQATASGYCVNGQTQVYISFPGGGYTSAATATISGGGTSGATGTVVLGGTAQAADPLGIADSYAAAQNAVDWDYASCAATGANPYACGVIYVPVGKYAFSHVLRFPYQMSMKCDSRAATTIEGTNDGQDIINVYIAPEYNQLGTYQSSGSIIGCTLDAVGDSLYQATEMEGFGTGFHLADDTILNGGGRGIQLINQSERGDFTNLTFEQVRWPMQMLGNEDRAWYINIEAPGTSGDNYSFGSNAVNGVDPNYYFNAATFVYAAGNGTTATFYLKASYVNSGYWNGTAYTPTSTGIAPILAGQHFTVAGTTVNSLDGNYVAASVTNNVTSDPSSTCSVSVPCFTVTAASSVNGAATLTGTTTTATFTSTSPTITLASATGFAPYVNVSGTGIASGSYLISLSGTTGVIYPNPTANETGSNVTAAAVWKPYFVPNLNPAFLMGGSADIYLGGSIKNLHDANCIRADGTYGGWIGSIYCEQYPVNGAAASSYSVYEGGAQPQTTLTGSLSGSCTISSFPAQDCTVTVASTQWFWNYENDPLDIIASGGTVGTIRLAPQDYLRGSTAPSAYVSGVERGQWEDVSGIFYGASGVTGAGSLMIEARDLSTSTAPVGTTWPSGSIAALRSIFPYIGTLTVTSLHENATSGFVSPGWSGAGCNDQTSPCASYLIGSIADELTTVQPDQCSGTGVSPCGAIGNLTLLGTEWWGSPLNQQTEPMGEGFIKSIGGGGGSATVAYGVESPTLGSTDQSAVYGQLLSDGYVNVQSADGSYPSGRFISLDTQEKWVNEGGSNGIGDPYRPFIGLGSGPAHSAAYHESLQVNSGWCIYDFGPVGGASAIRFCPIGVQGNDGVPEFDYWTGSAWTPDFQLGSYFAYLYQPLNLEGNPITGVTGIKASSGASSANCWNTNQGMTACGPPLSGQTGSIGGSALSVNACSSGTVSVSGATTSMHVFGVTPTSDPNGSGVQDYDWYGWVSAPGTVTVKVCALAAGTPTATTYNVLVQ